MTREGLSKLEAQYNEMKTNQLSECLSDISDARDKGDISENAEFETAKLAYETLLTKMQKLGDVLSSAIIIDSIIDNGTAQMLTTVSVKNLKTNATFNYKLVPEYETDVKNGKISSNSPIGKSLMNKKAGDIVKVVVPAGEIHLEIIGISI